MVWLAKLRHHEAGVAGGAAQVHQAALGQQDDLLAVGKTWSTWGLISSHWHFFELATSISLSKWPMLQTMAGPSWPPCARGDDVAVGGGGHEDVGLVGGVFHGHDL
jgi:hypothetical protein